MSGRIRNVVVLPPNSVKSSFVLYGDSRVEGYGKMEGKRMFDENAAAILPGYIGSIAGRSNGTIVSRNISEWPKDATGRREYD